MRDATSYRVIASYYDWIMAHVEYDAWGRYLRRLWAKTGAEPERILELGAGTCPFAGRGVYPEGADVVYSDLSPYMLARASDAAGTRVAANALALPFRGGFQLCLMVYDAFNHLMTEADALRCLDEVSRVLEKGGLFLFDITTEANSLRHFDQALDFGELEGCTYLRESRYDRQARLQSNDFTFFTEGAQGCWRKTRECHQQRIYRVADVLRLAERAGFAVAGCHEGFTFRAAREASERVHFSLRKPA